MTTDIDSTTIIALYEYKVVVADGAVLNIVISAIVLEAVNDIVLEGISGT